MGVTLVLEYQGSMVKTRKAASLWVHQIRSLELSKEASNSYNSYHLLGVYFRIYHVRTSHALLAIPPRTECQSTPQNESHDLQNQHPIQAGSQAVWFNQTIVDDDDDDDKLHHQ